MAQERRLSRLAVISDKLERLLSASSIENMEQILRDYQADGLQKSVLDHPIRRHGGRTAVHLVASKGQSNCLELLLKYGGNPNAVSSSTDLSQTPLHLAAIGGFPLCIQILLDYGAAIDARNSQMETAETMVKGKPKCERIFQDAVVRYRVPQRTNEQKQLAENLHSIVGTQSTEEFCKMYDELPQDHQDLSTRWTDDIVDKQTLLYRAASHGSSALEDIEYILSRSEKLPLPNLNTDETPLQIACKEGFHNVAKSLLTHSPNLLFVSKSKSGITPLHQACLAGDYEMVVLLLQAVEQYVASPAHDKKMKKSLDLCDKEGCTPFYYACDRGHFKIVEQIVNFQKKHKAQVHLDINAATKVSQRTPLHAAVQSGNLEIVSFLLSIKGINISPEGHPSSRTESKLIELHHRISHSQVIRKHLREDSIQEEDEVFSVDRKVSTPSNTFAPKPKPRRHRDASKKASRQSLPDVLSLPERPKPMPRRTRHRSEDLNRVPETQALKRHPHSISHLSRPEERLIVFENATTGKLTVDSKGTTKEESDDKEFRFISLTPLAEACANNYAEIVKSLLKSGARDKGGLACRIAHLIHEPSLIQQILSYHTDVKSSQVGGTKDTSLNVQWSCFKLPELKANLVGDEGVYRPCYKGQQAVASAVGHSDLKPTHVTLRCDAVREIYLDHNQLTSLPIQLFQLKNVQLIDVSSNKLVKLPTLPLDHDADHEFDGGWSCRSLRTLNITGNELTCLPPSVWELPHLESLSCSENKLNSLLTDMENVPSYNELTDVDFSHNNLFGILSGHLFELPSIRKVNLSKNEITGLPEALWKSSTLSDLDLSDNCLKNLLPESAGEIKANQQSIKHTHRHMQHADQILEGKVEIEATISTKQDSPSAPMRSVSTMKRTTSTQVDRCTYSALKTLNLSQNKFTAFPEALACFAPNLTSLDLSKNQLQEVDVHLLPPLLKMFTANQCEITRVGNVLSEENLTRMSQNCRRPMSIDPKCQHRNHSQLPYLKFIDLSGNQITHMQLICDVYDSTLEKTFDPSIKPINLLYPALLTLNLSENKLLGTFNPNIAHLKSLQSIKLSGNNSLERIPIEFGLLKGRDLTELRREDLPNLRDPPAEYRDTKLGSLLTYMKSRLKQSSNHRSIKLFLIGDGERGKTSLLRRLKQEEKKVDNRTIGIDIRKWSYPKGKKKNDKTVDFLIWDFAGQEVYHSTHQCFYSRRSMYLALFRLIDGEKGIDELDKWLKSVKLRAPGSPVIIVGTHLDQMRDPHEVRCLENWARKIYSDEKVYPHLVDVISISCLKQHSFGSHILSGIVKTPMEDLRSLLYKVACHLFLRKDGMSLVYMPNMPESDPKALLQQKIPKSFQDMDDKLSSVVQNLKQDGHDLIMDRKDFVATFMELFGDEDELMEAVYFHKLQGTLLHFEDHNLRDLFFLDPEWLAKLMAEVIHPDDTKNIAHGIAEIGSLFKKRKTSTRMKYTYVSLLQKFELAMDFSNQQVLIPSLMPQKASYPEPQDSCNAPRGIVENAYHPPLRRFWLAEFVSAGFWPRLIHRIVTDQQIEKVLQKVVDIDSPYVCTPQPVDGELDSGLAEAEIHQRGSHQKSNLNWTLWQTGLAYSLRNHTVFVMKQVANEPSEEFLMNKQLPKQVKMGLLVSKYRIEAHVYIEEWVSLIKELLQLNPNHNYSLDSIPSFATKLLIMVSNHVHDLALSWFPGMFVKPKYSEMPFFTYIPCWKCFTENVMPIDCVIEGETKGIFLSKDMAVISMFVLEENIVKVARRKPLQCCFHGSLDISHMAPDLIFKDLDSDKNCQHSKAPLHICEDKLLGEGGFGFVCKGELHSLSSENKKNVAVKLFMEIQARNQDAKISDLLELSKEDKNLELAYREIRKEVAFLSNLDHKNLAMLCGVKTTPYMCLMLELAPNKSLRTALKEYRDHSMPLESLTLKNAALQIARGLHYLHSNKIVHLDMKSPNILLWYFPSPQDSRQVRIREAAKVLVKIADYGISQVSNNLTIKFHSQALGTPGFMAPELFDRIGQEIPSDKLDVFGYAMVLYELMSQASPFEDIFPVWKRNNLIQQDQRPALQAKETRTLIQMQDIMRMCWEKEPENRPTMSQVVEWIRAPEFERLRAEITLSKVNFIPCLCICHILPEHEHTTDEHQRVHYETETTISNDVQMFYDDGACITSLKGIKVAEKEDIYQFLPVNSEKANACGQENLQLQPEDMQLQTADSEDTQQQAEDTQLQEKDTDDSEHARPGPHQEALKEIEMFDPYTQVWMCRENDRRNGLLHIFTYHDKLPGNYLYSGYCSREEITCICPVRNMMWMGTSAGAIKVFHAPTLKTKFTCRLDKREIEGKVQLNILYIEEVNTVMVINEVGEIWCFHDTIVKCDLVQQCKINGPPLSHLTKVILRGGSEVEVWGTMKDNRLWVMKNEKASGNWLPSELTITPNDPNLKVTSFIAFTSFTDSTGEEAEHIWASYHRTNALVSFNARSKMQRVVFRCDTKLNADRFEITALTCTGHRVIVGTSTGSVVIFHSKSADLLCHLKWHSGNVHTLLVMPKEIEPCICAEVPFAGSSDEDAGGVPDSVMVSSLGVGKREYRCAKGDAKKSSTEDISMLTWRLDV